MDIFKIKLPTEEENENFTEIGDWFDHINEQFKTND